MSIPVTKNVTIRFGDSHEVFFRVFERTFNQVSGKWEKGAPRDLTGYTIEAQIRLNTDAATELAEYTATLGNQSDVVSGRGAVYLRISDVITGALRNLNPVPTQGVWDCQFTTPAGEVFTYIEGTVTFKKDVTR